jgi:hypothetical protein
MGELLPVEVRDAAMQPVTLKLGRQAIRLEGLVNYCCWPTRNAPDRIWNATSTKHSQPKLATLHNPHITPPLIFGPVTLPIPLPIPRYVCLLQHTPTPTLIVPTSPADARRSYRRSSNPCRSPQKTHSQQSEHGQNQFPYTHPESASLHHLLLPDAKRQIRRAPRIGIVRAALSLLLIPSTFLPGHQIQPEA